MSHGLGRDGWPTADTVLKTERRLYAELEAKFATLTAENAALRAEVEADIKPCCGLWDDCTERCVPRANAWKGRAEQTEAALATALRERDEAVEDAGHLWHALKDLSFDCDGVTQTQTPQRGTYNATFLVAQRLADKYQSSPHYQQRIPGQPAMNMPLRKIDACIDADAIRARAAAEDQREPAAIEGSEQAPAARPDKRLVRSDSQSGSHPSAPSSGGNSYSYHDETERLRAAGGYRDTVPAGERCSAAEPAVPADYRTLVALAEACSSIIYGGDCGWESVDPKEFIARVRKALLSRPAPLSEEQIYELARKNIGDKWPADQSPFPLLDFARALEAELGRAK